jgi:hypothetical protein
MTRMSRMIFSNRRQVGRVTHLRAALCDRIAAAHKLWPTALPFALALGGKARQ